MKEITVNATLQQQETVMTFIDEYLDQLECSIKAKMQIDVAIDEVFSNIAKYAYNDSTGKATIILEPIDDNKKVKLTFIDSGIPFDPLKAADPDVSMDARQRDIGGLGIFMVKKMMENVQYHWENGCNILSFEKAI